MNKTIVGGNRTDETICEVLAEVGVFHACHRPVHLQTYRRVSVLDAMVHMRDLILVLPTLLLWFCAGCRTANPLPPADFSQPGWRVQQGQAVWKSVNRPELAGDLLLATNVNGSLFIQFSKTPFPLATAQIAGGQWQIQFGTDEFAWRGNGSPPDRFSWFQLPRALRGENLKSNWRLENTGTNLWRLENSQTGEWLEGEFFQ